MTMFILARPGSWHAFVLAAAAGKAGCELCDSRALETRVPELQQGLQRYACTQHRQSTHPDMMMQHWSYQRGDYHALFLRVTLTCTSHADCATTLPWSTACLLAPKAWRSNQQGAHLQGPIVADHTKEVVQGAGHLLDRSWSAVGCQIEAVLWNGHTAGVLHGPWLKSWSCLAALVLTIWT